MAEAPSVLFQLRDERLPAAVHELLQPLHLPTLAAGQDCPPATTYLLVYEHGCLSLRQTVPRAPAPTCVDFLASSLEWRRRTSGKSQGVGQAVGLKKLGRRSPAGPRVLDATAGLGRDAFILASLGAQVTLLERSPLIHALLADGLRRARQACGLDPAADIRAHSFLSASAGAQVADIQSELTAAISRMSVQQAEAAAWLHGVLRGETEPFDVIYLDPMFPPRDKSARVKKDIAVLQDILGIDEDFPRLLALARQCARHRVVVKRPGSKTGKGELQPDFQIPGKACHFDVYLPVKQA